MSLYLYPSQTQIFFPLGYKLLSSGLLPVLCWDSVVGAHLWGQRLDPGHMHTKHALSMLCSPSSPKHINVILEYGF